jgi:fatty acid desaturase
MLNGVLVGFGIMLASLVIPIVHYVSAPLSPFIAGFIGGGVAKIDQDGIIKFGALTALLMFIPALAVLVLKFVVGVDEILNIPTTWVMIAVLVLIPYTWFGATVGALGGYYIRKNQEESAS